MLLALTVACFWDLSCRCPWVLGWFLKSSMHLPWTIKQADGRLLITQLAGEVGYESSYIFVHYVELKITPTWCHLAVFSLYGWLTCQFMAPHRFHPHPCRSSICGIVKISKMVGNSAIAIHSTGGATESWRIACKHLHVFLPGYNTLIMVFLNVYNCAWKMASVKM